MQRKGILLSEPGSSTGRHAVALYSLAWSLHKNEPASIVDFDEILEFKIWLLFNHFSLSKTLRHP